MYRPQRWLIRVIIHVTSAGVQVKRWVTSCQIIVKNPSMSLRTQVTSRHLGFGPRLPWEQTFGGCVRIYKYEDKLRPTLPPNWQGSCAKAQLLTLSDSELSFERIFLTPVFLHIIFFFLKLHDVIGKYRRHLNLSF